MEEPRALRLAQRIGSQKSGSSIGAPATAYMREDVAGLVPRREHQEVVRQAAAHHLRHLGEHLPDVERAGHRVQEPPQAVDALAAEELALLERRGLDGQRQQVGDGVHQGLVLAAEGVVG